VDTGAADHEERRPMRFPEALIRGTNREWPKALRGPSRSLRCLNSLMASGTGRDLPDLELIMTHYHACVWIDHREAKVFAFGAEGSEEADLVDHKAQHHIHRKANQVGLGTAPADDAFLAEVAEALKPAGAILIAGPGRAKTDLDSYLKQHFPAVAKNVRRVEAMDHPTEPEILAAAREYFRRDDKMHQ
jgi:hypothetical protein